MVSDSWDIFHAYAAWWSRELRSEIMNNTQRTVVVRPDSGDPVKVLPEVLNTLGAAFGHTTNEKGFRVLPDQVRVIQGDGITRHSLP